MDDNLRVKWVSVYGLRSESAGFFRRAKPSKAAALCKLLRAKAFVIIVCVCVCVCVLFCSTHSLSRIHTYFLSLSHTQLFRVLLRVLSQPLGKSWARSKSVAVSVGLMGSWATPTVRAFEFACARSSIRKPESEREKGKREKMLREFGQQVFGHDERYEHKTL